MSLYNHFANRDEIVDGIVDLVFAEIDLLSDDGDWKAAMRRRAISLRDVLLRHRWAIGLMESRRNAGPANLRHHDAVIGSLRAGGFGHPDGRPRVLASSTATSTASRCTKLTLPFDTAGGGRRGGGGHASGRSTSTSTPTSSQMIDHALKPGYDYLDGSSTASTLSSTASRGSGQQPDVAHRSRSTAPESSPDPLDRQLAPGLIAALRGHTSTTGNRRGQSAGILWLSRLLAVSPEDETEQHPGDDQGDPVDRR